jgi:mono/diheme cytochrome c family protein
MVFMHFRYIVAGLALAASLSAQDRKQVELGRYLVESIGQCATCHTPKNEKGELDKSKWMKGAVMDIQPLGTPPPKMAQNISGSHPKRQALGEVGRGVHAEVSTNRAHAQRETRRSADADVQVFE